MLFAKRKLLEPEWAKVVGLTYFIVKKMRA